MYAGAAIAAVRLIVGLVLLIIDFDAGARGTIMGHSITGPSMRAPVITGWVVFSLAWVALWLWMARANGRGRSWARIVSTVLFGWLTLDRVFELLFGVIHSLFGEARAGAEQDKGTPVA